MRPQNTTWLRIPGLSGDDWAPVNCLKPHVIPGIYRLARCDVDDLADFPPTPPLLDVPVSHTLHFLLGIKWSFRPKDRSMAFLVRLLCGRLEYDRRLFRAYDEVDVAKLDTRTDEVRLGPAPLPAGPEPSLTRRNDAGRS